MSLAMLDEVKKRIWFYEFELPDGSITQTNIPADVLRIHTSRRDKLRRVIAERVGDASNLTALDFASHEGYFSFELARHFGQVHGVEYRDESFAACLAMQAALGVSNVTFTQGDLTKLTTNDIAPADLVLVYGLLYHLENPIHVLRLASQLSKKHILIETQIFPYDIAGKLEEGHYIWQREVSGVFSLSSDYHHVREGGSTDIALVPSLNALLFLMSDFGFKTIEVIKPDPDDYEQFSRGSRVVVYGAK